MVLGLRSKNRNGTSVQVKYIIHVQEIKPWPPSQSLRSVQSVLLQWESGEQTLGSLTSIVGDANIKFNESFMLPLTLKTEKRSNDRFQKNHLEFNLYEPRKDKAGKSQLLGTAIINLADYGIIEETLAIGVPLNFKKSSKNVAQTILSVEIQPALKGSFNSSSKLSLSKEASLDKDGQESVSETLTTENDDEEEIASFTDDDVSSHSSRTFGSLAFDAAGSSPSQNVQSESESVTEKKECVEGPVPASEIKPMALTINPGAEACKQPSGTSHTQSSASSSSDLKNTVATDADILELPERNKILMNQVSANSFSPMIKQDELGKSGDCKISFDGHENPDDDSEIEEYVEQSIDRTSYLSRLADKLEPVSLKFSSASSRDVPVNANIHRQLSQEKSDQLEPTIVKNVQVESVGSKVKIEDVGEDGQILEENRHPPVIRQVGKPSYDSTRKQGIARSETLTSGRRAVGVPGNSVTTGKLKHVNSLQLPYNPAKNNVISGNNHTEQAKKIEKSHAAVASKSPSQRREKTNGIFEGKAEWESRIEQLEEELREAAAIEAGLYSVVAEHGSSTNKVHASARRLSRFYLHACKERSQDKIAGAARAAVSGLVLVSKACGNDVPRLTFWLSNSIMLRAIVNQDIGKKKSSDGSCIASNVGRVESGERPSKGNNSAPVREEISNSLDNFDDWENPQTFAFALEKVEAWIFSRIIESVWWQTLTPHMQSTAAKSRGKSAGQNSRKIYGSRSDLSDQDQGSFSIELWKKAFTDACERLCPVRAGGHECGCLPVIARLVMGQLVNRLDVAMFNAILRESTEEMPTDPVSDPISDSKVLPIPAGRTSFGAGVQLKNAIGNWSRWLTDVFGIEDHDSPEDDTDMGDDKMLEPDASFKPFRLLNALSDLMMLPFEMLADASTRKEVCPTLGATLIKIVLYNFVPDEFCPHPVPDSVFEALESEDESEATTDCVTSFPYIATPTVYMPPPAASLAGIIGEIGSQTIQRSSSSVLKKSYTSDDELDELDSPLTSIIFDKLQVTPAVIKSNPVPQRKGGRKAIRYQLLREVWGDRE